jgi:hypothetical protein
MRDPEHLPKVPRRIKQVSKKFIHNKRLTRKQRRRLVRWINDRHRDIGATPMRQLPDGR